MKISKIYLITALFLSIFSISNQYASTHTNKSNSVITEYKGFYYYLENEELVFKIMESSTINVEEDEIYYLSNIMKNCKQFMDYAGNRLSDVTLVDEPLVDEFKLYKDKHCI
jgi:hypothetical protein